MLVDYVISSTLAAVTGAKIKTYNRGLWATSQQKARTHQWCASIQNVLSLAFTPSMFLFEIKIRACGSMWINSDLTWHLMGGFSPVTAGWLLRRLMGVRSSLLSRRRPTPGNTS